jgi:hypothetical protein
LNPRCEWDRGGILAGGSLEVDCAQELTALHGIRRPGVPLSIWRTAKKELAQNAKKTLELLALDTTDPQARREANSRQRTTETQAARRRAAIRASSVDYWRNRHNLGIDAPNSMEVCARLVNIFSAVFLIPTTDQGDQHEQQPIRTSAYSLERVIATQGTRLWLRGWLQDGN